MFLYERRAEAAFLGRTKVRSELRSEQGSVCFCVLNWVDLVLSPGAVKREAREERHGFLDRFVVSIS